MQGAIGRGGGRGLGMTKPAWMTTGDVQPATVGGLKDGSPDRERSEDNVEDDPPGSPSSSSLPVAAAVGRGRGRGRGRGGGGTAIAGIAELDANMGRGPAKGPPIGAGGGKPLGPAKVEKDFRGPSGLFQKGDWTCTACGNINWERRSECNKCNNPKPNLVATNEVRDGFGGGFNERQDRASVATVEVDEDGYDDFGRRKKKARADKKAKEEAALARLRKSYGSVLLGVTGLAPTSVVPPTVVSGQFDDAAEGRHNELRRDRGSASEGTSGTTGGAEGKLDSNGRDRGSSTRDRGGEGDQNGGGEDEERGRDRSRDGDRGRGRGRSRSRSKGRSRDRNRGKERSKERMRDADRRDRGQDKGRDRSSDRTGGRGRGRGRSRSRERDRGKERGRDRGRSADKSRSRDRSVERDRDRDRHRRHRSRSSSRSRRR